MNEFGATLLTGDCREVLPTLAEGSVHCVVTSPPYWGLRDYGCEGQIGLEDSLAAYLETLVAVFREVRRVLRPDGVMFLNMGDSYFHGGGRRGDVCDTSDKGPANSPGRDCLCGSLCDACRRAYQIGRSHSDDMTAPMPTPSPSATSHECTEFEPDRLPTSGLASPDDRSEAAIPGQPPAASRVPDKPFGAPESSTPESLRQPLGGCLPMGSRGECQLCGRSLAACALGSECMKACPCAARTEILSRSDRRANTGGSAVTGDSSGSRSAGKASDLAYPDYTIPSRLKPKDLMMLPHRLALALQADGWYVRSDIVWSKPNPMPESVADRPTRSHEYVFLLSKSARYFYDADAIREPLVEPVPPHTWEDRKARGEPMRRGLSPGRSLTTPGGVGSNPAGRNKRSVWEIATQPTPEAHFAVFPEKLVEPCILAGTSERGCCSECGAPWVRVVERRNERNRPGRVSATDGTKAHFIGKGSGGNTNLRYHKGTPETISERWQPACTCNANTQPCTVLDPFAGSGTVCRVATRLGRRSIGIELSSTYVETIARARTAQQGLMI